MTEVESVALWASLIVGIASVVLAGVAIVVSLLVSARDNKLSNEFSTALGTIGTLSSETKEQLNIMLAQVVEAFIELRQPAQVSTFEQSAEVAEGSEGLPSKTDVVLEQFNRRLQELEVRQRFQVKEPQITAQDLLDFDEAGISKPERGVFTRFDLTKPTLANPEDLSA